MFNELISCWPLERKHKVPKSHGADVRNTRTYGRSLLHEVLCEHLAVLSNPDTFAFNRFGLSEPRVAPKKAAEFDREALHLDADVNFSCHHATKSHPSEAVYCSVGDVALVQDPSTNDIVVAEIRANLSVEDEVLAIVACWTMLSVADGAATWRLSENLRLIHGKSIVDVLCWTRLSDDQAKTLLPREFC